MPYISKNPVFGHSSSFRINGVVILSLAWTLWAMQKEHVSVQRCDERGNPTLNQLALIIPIYPNPCAGNICIPRRVQYYGFSQSSHSCTKWVGNIFLWNSTVAVLWKMSHGQQRREDNSNNACFQVNLEEMLLLVCKNSHLDLIPSKPIWPMTMGINHGQWCQSFKSYLICFEDLCKPFTLHVPANHMDYKGLILNEASLKKNWK